jgi:hypothetical protein
MNPFLKTAYAPPLNSSTKAAKDGGQRFWRQHAFLGFLRALVTRLRRNSRVSVHGAAERQANQKVVTSRTRDTYLRQLVELSPGWYKRSRSLITD